MMFKPSLHISASASDDVSVSSYCSALLFLSVSDVKCCSSGSIVLIHLNNDGTASFFRHLKCDSGSIQSSCRKCSLHILVYFLGLKYLGSRLILVVHFVSIAVLSNGSLCHDKSFRVSELLLHSPAQQ